MGARLFTVRWALEVLVTAMAVAASFVVVSSLLGVAISGAWARALGGLAGCVGLPLLARWRLRRAWPKARLGAWFLAGWCLLAAAVPCLAFPAPTGAALRSHGAWCVGKTQGWFPRRYRRAVDRVGGLLEARLAVGTGRRSRSPVSHR